MRTLALILAFCLITSSSLYAAEFLIYDKDHWMDELPPQELRRPISSGQISQEEYDSRYRRGDVVEVRPNGYWTGPRAKGFNREAFRVITVPAMPYEAAYIPKEN